MLDDGWSFVLTELGTTVEQYRELAWQARPVDLPHDWLIYDTRDLYADGTGWYRRVLRIDSLDEYERVLRFDGVYMDCRVYINGVLAASHPYGYTTFDVPLTNLTEGDNEILVSVNHEAPNSRWYSGAGIYRDVWLLTLSHTHFAMDGIYVHTAPAIHGDYSVFNLEVEAEIEGATDDIIVLASLAGPKGGECLFELHRQDDKHWAAVAKYENPLLWDDEHPEMYELTLVISRDGRRTDTVMEKIGFREFSFSPDLGLLVNGAVKKLHGVCLHHDLGCLGAAFNKAAMKRQLNIMRDMGVNAIRTSHNPPDPKLMELADEMGFYIDDECFDMWEEHKTAHDYAGFFDEWYREDVASWVRRDRNHPSVLMWSIGNEIHDVNVPRGAVVAGLIKNEVLSHDPKGNAHLTQGSNYMTSPGAWDCADIVGAAGYNYSENLYDEHHALHPDWIIYGSETSSVVSSRGVYHFPCELNLLTDEDGQCSALGNSAVSWGARNEQYDIEMHRDRSYCPGQFIWTGIDYIGEPTPYRSKNSFFGKVDTAGFPKDGFYMYRAEWTDYRVTPFVHLIPSVWDFTPGEMIDVRVVSNAPAIEAFCNGRTIGAARIDHEHGLDGELIPTFRIPYESGYIRAVAYDEDGAIIAVDEQRTAGDARALRLEVESPVLHDDGRDLAFVEITAIDRQGLTVENASVYVDVALSGPGRILGLDNGDSTDYDQYKTTRRKLFNGKLLAVIGSTTVPGNITVTVSSPYDESVRPATATIMVLATTEDTEGVSCNESCEMEPLVTGHDGLVPVRKIEIVPDRTLLDADHPATLVHAQVYPQSATDQDVEFKIVTAAGLRSGVARVEETGPCTCTVYGIGDGGCFLRAVSRSGTDSPRVMAQIGMQVQGIGTAYMDPYEYTYGGQYTGQQGDVAGFTENSVSTSRKNGCVISYDDMDFGAFGSDEVTIDIFSNNDSDRYFQIWDGKPGDGEKLCDAVAHPAKAWATYEPERYTLSKRLQGVHTLSLVTETAQYFSVRGFVFDRKEKAYAYLRSTEADALYGDEFVMTEDAVEHIGNNVTLDYTDMDFGDEGATGVTIEGRTNLASNTITLQYGDGQRVSVEFPHSEAYTKQSYEIPKLTGTQRLSVIFLPGSNFDLRGLQFHKAQSPGGAV